MDKFQSINVSKGKKTLEIKNSSGYPLIGSGAQGAVFKLSEERCVKVYAREEQAKMEQKALKAGSHLPFFPKVFEVGKNYIVMEYFDAPTLKEYLNGCTYMPESITIKLLDLLKEFKKSKFTMIDAPLRHIFVLKNQDLKVIDHVNAFKRNHPVPLKLLRDLDLLFLKDSFLSQVKKIEPKIYEEWMKYYQIDKVDFEKIEVYSEKGNSVKVDSTLAHQLIGKGHQGAVFRIKENQCVKVYGKKDHAKQEQKVLMSCQHLSFIPKVYEVGSNYIVMEYLLGPDLNTYLKKQTELSEEISMHLYDMLKSMKQSGFKQIDAPLRHIIVTPQGFKLLDHVYSFSRKQEKPIELFENLEKLNFLESFLEYVKNRDSSLYKEWMK